MQNQFPLEIPSDIVTLKIAVLGKTLVGKSALTFRFIKDRFPNEHDTTIEDQYTVPTQIDGIECRLEILDTAGQDDYQTMLDTWINSVDGYILVYSIDDKDSFNSTRMRYERIVKNKGRSNYSMIIVGNKCDLESKREVSREEAEKYCMGLGVDFLETSALNKINVKESFLCVAKGLLKLKFPEKYNEDKLISKKKCYCF
jgi:small GTP-binding protein